MSDHDVVVIGAGVVGCATAMSLLEGDPALDVAVVDKETHLGRHQSGRNSGVLQPGYGQPPGSTESKLRTNGVDEVTEFCRRHDVPFRNDGAMMVSSNPREDRALETVSERATSAGIDVEWLDEQAVAKREPNAVAGTGLVIPSETVIDSPQYLHALANECVHRGARFYLDHEVTRLVDGDPVRIELGDDTIAATVAVNCAGLHADRIARQVGLASDRRIVPFRCVYYELVPERTDLCRSLLYPAPALDRQTPGVKFVPRPDGKVLVGPTVSPALGYESYSSAFESHDLRRIASHPGFWRFLATPETVRMAATELRKTYSKRAFLRKARHVLPGLQSSDLRRSFAAVALRMITDDGEMDSGTLDVRTTDRTVHVLNPLSAGISVSIPLGESVSKLVLERT